MNYYEIHAKISVCRKKTEEETGEKMPFVSQSDMKRSYKAFCKEINEQLDMNSERTTSVYAYHAAEGVVKFIYEADQKEIRSGKVRKEIEKILTGCDEVKSFSLMKPKEITGENFYKLGRSASRNNYIDRFYDDGLGVFCNPHIPFTIKEALLPDKKQSRTQLLKEAGEALADDSFVHEIERIFSDENKKEYYGNPVHYYLTVSGRESVKKMVAILGKALLENKRLLGRRITYVSEIEEECYNEEDFENMVARSDGNIVVFDMSGSYEDHGSYANAYHRVIDYVDKMFGKYQRKTLWVFVKNQEHPGFADVMISKVADRVKLVGLKEGGGNAEKALRYLQGLATDDGQPISESELKKVLSAKTYYTVGELHEIYSKCFSDVLMYDIYKAYKTCSYFTADDGKKLSGPYETLQNMIGLSEIKKVVDSVINNARIQKIRSSKGLDTYKSSMHMVFTGNPGSAKTTVARLIAQILAKEGIIEKNEIVECGRADLVGRYVGWTAKEVIFRFRQASGGVLFIDEAYSLVDDSHSFGDEAINTIVQEMENHRDDVIVIFAGYPDKMQEFLDKNEGLRSRIAFHLDFPDYDEDELVQILQLMAKQKGFTLEDGVTERCRGIFADALRHKDFGNGRFVRNLLEQAILAQADRLYREYKGKRISTKALNSLIRDDFDVNAGRQYVEKKPVLGFSA
ncbi:MAG: AAA family ATPase [Lachnospiraceae bacterium]|nr:AAA family ATPase [Lachnospiraceae bacterium]